MLDWVRAETDNLIQLYGLHASGDPEVDLSPLADLFPWRYDDLSLLGVKGLILPPPQGWPALVCNKARVVVDETLGRGWHARLVYAHEIGHGICRHIGSAKASSLGLSERMEREAWEVAARLLLPAEVCMEVGVIHHVAALCYVPEWLVQVRHEGSMEARF